MLWLFDDADPSVDKCRATLKREFALVIHRSKKKYVRDMENWLQQLAWFVFFCFPCLYILFIFINIISRGTPPPVSSKNTIHMDDYLHGMYSFETIKHPYTLHLFINATSSCTNEKIRGNQSHKLYQFRSKQCYLP
jgi:hypothetical protein